MNFFDWVVNIGCILCLLLSSVRAAVAYDQRKMGRFAFCVSFGIFVLRVLLARWLTGVTKSAGVSPNAELAAFISSNEATVVIVILVVGSFAWVTIEEYWENRERRRLKRIATQQVKSLIDKDKEIDRLSQSATLADGALDASDWNGKERRTRPRIDKNKGLGSDDSRFYAR